METFAVDGFPDAKLMLALFTNVKNAADLKRKYLNRIALLDAGLVLSVFQLRVAAAMAVEKEKAGKMKTRSLPSEMVWSLSGSKNITGTLQTFCVQASEVDDADLLVAAIGIDEDDLRSVLADIKGQPCGLEKLGVGLHPVDGGVGDGQQQQQQQQQQRQGGDASKGRERLKKLYKITEEELAVNNLEDCVVMRMAVKDH
ncbi:unnamed protein product [Ectocarpus sp. CCAP 1310/34]|nr:unnamed protein product [Ectocarpus sp. CCAP 1310/34]